jgi:hypothetical protein
VGEPEHRVLEVPPQVPRLAEEGETSLSFWEKLYLKAERARRRGDYGLLVRWKRDMAGCTDPRIIGDPWFRRLQEFLKDVPAEGYTCECCGYRGLVNVHVKDGHIVGPCCYNHPFGSCRRRAA